MKLRAKVNLALSGAFFVGLLVATGGAYKILNNEAVESSARDARLVMEQASAIRTYTADAIRPLLERQMNVQFLPHTIPSYAAQTNFKIVQKKLPEYAYREPALNPTNVNDRAVDWEAEIINDFRGNPDRTERMVIRDTPVGSSSPWRARSRSVRRPAWPATARPKRRPRQWWRFTDRRTGSAGNRGKPSRPR